MAGLSSPLPSASLFLFHAQGSGAQSKDHSGVSAYVNKPEFMQSYKFGSRRMSCVLSTQFVRRDNFRILSIPLDLAAQPVSVLAKNPERLNWAPVPMLNPAQCSPDLFGDRARVNVVVESDEPKVICAVFHVLVGQIGKLRRSKQSWGSYGRNRNRSLKTLL
jgi:hypothetical protein